MRYLSIPESKVSVTKEYIEWRQALADLRDIEELYFVGKAEWKKLNWTRTMTPNWVTD